MITKDGKLFGKINIFDFITIFLVVVLLFGLGYKFLVLDRNNMKNTVNVVYNMEIKGVRDLTVGSFKVGDKVFDYKSEENIGTITNIATKQATTVMETLEGTIIDAPIDERYDIMLTVQTTAIKQSDDSLVIGKSKVLEGYELKITTQIANCIAVMKNVDIK